MVFLETPPPQKDQTLSQRRVFAHRGSKLGLFCRGQEKTVFLVRCSRKGSVTLTISPGIHVACLLFEYNDWLYSPISIYTVRNLLFPPSWKGEPKIGSDAHINKWGDSPPECPLSSLVSGWAKTSTEVSDSSRPWDLASLHPGSRPCESWGGGENGVMAGCIHLLSLFSSKLAMWS